MATAKRSRNRLYYSIFYSGYYQPEACRTLKGAKEEAIKALSRIGGRLSIDAKRTTNLGTLVAFSGTPRVLAFSKADACKRVKHRFILAKNVLNGAIAIPLEE